MEDKRDMEKLIHTLAEICTEHLVMRRILREDKQLQNVRERCRLASYRDAVYKEFREAFGSNLDNLPNEITPAQLLAALSTTNLAD